MPIKTIVEQVFNSPGDWHQKTAYIDHEERVTYGETRQTMLQIAAWLNERFDVQAGDRVAICLPMGIAAAQITLGVMAAGALFVPLQFGGPSHRLAQMISGLTPKLLITTKLMTRKLGGALAGVPSLSVAEIENSYTKLDALLTEINPIGRPAEVDDSSIAAVYFTSGSTGEPKGAMMSRRSTADTAAIFAEYAPLNQSDIIYLSAPLHYGAALSLYYPLYAGCSAYIASEQETTFP